MKLESTSQHTAALEEAPTNLKSLSTKMKTDTEGWRRKRVSMEEELGVEKG